MPLVLLLADVTAAGLQSTYGSVQDNTKQV